MKNSAANDVSALIQFFLAVASQFTELKPESREIITSVEVAMTPGQQNSCVISIT
jgi:hypothetical protein